MYVNSKLGGAAPNKVVNGVNLLIDWASSRWMVQWLFAQVTVHTNKCHRVVVSNLGCINWLRYLQIVMIVNPTEHQSHHSVVHNTEGPKFRIYWIFTYFKFESTPIIYFKVLETIQIYVKNMFCIKNILATGILCVIGHISAVVFFLENFLKHILYNIFFNRFLSCVLLVGFP